MYNPIEAYLPLNIALRDTATIWGELSCDGSLGKSDVDLCFEYRCSHQCPLCQYVMDVSGNDRNIPAVCEDLCPLIDLWEMTSMGSLERYFYNTVPCERNNSPYNQWKVGAGEAFIEYYILLYDREFFALLIAEEAKMLEEALNDNS